MCAATGFYSQPKAATLALSNLIYIDWRRKFCSSAPCCSMFLKILVYFKSTPVFYKDVYC